MWVKVRATVQQEWLSGCRELLSQGIGRSKDSSNDLLGSPKASPLHSQGDVAGWNGVKHENTVSKGEEWPRTPSCDLGPGLQSCLSDYLVQTMEKWERVTSATYWPQCRTLDCNCLLGSLPQFSSEKQEWIYHFKLDWQLNHYCQALRDFQWGVDWAKLTIKPASTRRGQQRVSLPHSTTELTNSFSKPSSVLELRACNGPDIGLAHVRELSLSLEKG